MRAKSQSGPLSVLAIAGSSVVLLGIDLEQASSAGLLGFAIERTDHAENEKYWLQGFKTFAATDQGLPAGTLYSTLEQPVQDFQWSDFTAKPQHSYTYRVIAIRGTPKNLQQTEEVSVDISTQDEDTGRHAIFFNRGVAGSQAYARKFGNRKPGEVGQAAWDWLSRGLVEALHAYIAQAADATWSLRAALYEFQYLPVLKDFGDAAARGADVKIVFDARKNAADYPDKANRDAIAQAGIGDLTIPRTAGKSYIAHNKFIVLLKDGKPVQVWTGSTNITDGGIFGHSNVGHLVRDENVAAIYLAYWDQLVTDPQEKALQIWTEAHTSLPADYAQTPAGSIRPVFSPRPTLQALEWYRDRMDQAKSGVFFTAAFGVNDLFAKVLQQPRDYLRYVLLEKTDAKTPSIQVDPDVRIAYGSVIGNDVFDRWLLEETTGLNDHVKFIHTKYMLVDPLGPDPLVISGSANFSDASTHNNDENMLIIRGDEAVVDIYLGEFMRLFKHFAFRDFVEKAKAGTPAAAGTGHLVPDDSWVQWFYQPGTVRTKQRLLFSGQ